MPLDNLSHNVDEYYVGKGIVTIKPLPGSTWFDVGNVPEFEFTPTIEELPHNSSRAGVRARDRTVILEKGGDLRIVLEEWTSRNMAIILMGEETVTPGVDPAPDVIDIEILSLSQFSCAVRFQGQNDIGARWNFQFERVDFIPTGSINPISEEWGTFEITGRAAQVDIGGGVLSFGFARRMSDGSSPAWPA